jgi:hypothetical protein
MSETPKVTVIKNMKKLSQRLRDDFQSTDFILLFAYNSTGKTRLSMEFKDVGKKEIALPFTVGSGSELTDGGGVGFSEIGTKGDTLYFNAFTEDLFTWDNDLENDTERYLKINSDSSFFSGFKELALEEKIFSFLQRYVEFDFKIDYENWKVVFSKKIKNPRFRQGSNEPETIIQDNIKISKGEESIFIWCIFLTICQLVVDGDDSYNWVKFIYIDDPITSLDENHAIAVATDLAKVLYKGKGKIKAVVSSHHSLFFNVMYNELKKNKVTSYFLHKNKDEGFTLQKTNDTPFFHHVATLSELKNVLDSGTYKTHHFNMLRSVLEKTAVFFGYDDFSDCLSDFEDEVLYSRALNLLSHGAYSLYEPRDMGPDTKEIFEAVLKAFLEKYKFQLPEIIKE